MTEPTTPSGEAQGRGARTGVRPCTACGQDVPARFRFCGHCGAAQLPQSGGASTAPEAERRQLTVLFCDLVGSTVLAEQLDPEELRDVMRLYNTLCAGIVARLGGVVAEVAGDGLIIFFGYPRAFEDAAERAVLAGLRLVDAVSRLQMAVPLRVRIGIATGLMVVGDLIETGGIRQREIVGSPANLAARLQKLAAPGSVAISHATRTLIGGAFTCKDLGLHVLAGIDAAVRAFAVVAESGATDRFEARAASPLPPLVDREAERALLAERWRSTKAGAGQVVLLSGEPGIGKSRLVRDLLDRLTGEAYLCRRVTGSLLHRHTPLHPIAQLLRQAAGIERSDGLAARRRKLEVMLPPLVNARSIESVRLVAGFLGSPSDPEATHDARPPGHRKDRLLGALLDIVEARTHQGPMLMVFEDFHWIDATTHELVAKLVDRISAWPVLIVVTTRADLDLAWTALPHVTSLRLQPMAPAAAGQVMAGVLRHRTLPADVASTILARADGIPLFVEELTKAVLEARDTAVGQPPPTPGAVPETLQATLLARLDRHADSRSVAQTAAVIGREFPYELLAMISPLSAAALHAALDDLLASELIVQEGRPPRASFTFKHALLQEAAYESQLKRRRRAIHAQIAEALAKHFPETPPEVIGHHQAEAGAADDAVRSYGRAAELARGRSANVEAAAHFARALQLLETLPPGAARDRRELDLQIGHGAQLIAVQGNAANEVGIAYRRALALCQTVGEAGPRFRVLRGLQTFHMVRGQLANARPLGERLLDEATRAEDVDLLLQAHRPHGLCLLYMGEFAAARHHLSRAVALYDPARHAEHRFLYGSDPGVLAHCNLAWAEWFLDQPQRARELSDKALALAALPAPHPHSQAFALSLAASLAQFEGAAGRALGLADEVIDLAQRHHFSYWRSWGLVVRGWARATLGEADTGLGECRAGLAAYEATGAGLMCPYFLGLEAEALGATGRPQDAQAAARARAGARGCGKHRLLRGRAAPGHGGHDDRCRGAARGTLQVLAAGAGRSPRARSGCRRAAGRGGAASRWATADTRGS